MGLADIMVGQQLAATDPQKGPDVAGNYAKGAELAMHAEELAQKQQQLDQQKQEIDKAKYGKFMDAIAKVDDFKDPSAQKNFIKMLPNYAKSLQIDVPPENLNFLVQTPDMRARAATVWDARLNDRISQEQLVQMILDPIGMSGVPPSQKALFKQSGVDPDAFTNISDEERASLLKMIPDAATKSAEFQMQKKRMDQADEHFDANQGRQAAEFRAQQKVSLNKLLDERQITELDTRFAKLKELVPGIFEGDKTGKKGNLKGVSAHANIPTNLLSDPESELRQTALGIMNARLKKMSGSAVTASELPRLASSLGMKIGPLEGGGFMAVFQGNPSPKNFVNGMRDLKGIVDADKASLRRTFGHGVYNEVLTEMGGTPEPVPKQAAGGGKTKTPPAPKSFQVRGKPMTAAAAKEYAMRGAAQLEKLAKEMGTDAKTLATQLGIPGVE